MAKSLVKLLVGVKVKTTKVISWHKLSIPKGTRGVITSIGTRGKSAVVKFDDGRKYGSFEVWANELRLA